MSNFEQSPMSSEKNLPISITVLEQETRFCLRIDPKSLARASKALGFKLPSEIGGRTDIKDGYAAMLGPDEWVIKTAEANREKILTNFAALYENVPHSLTDISDREMTICLEGAAVEDLIAIGNPLDLRQFSSGKTTRTLFDTVQIVLHRDREDCFRIDVWRSFFPHVMRLLEVGNKELATGL